ncbi:MAG: tetratricopeptide repeat protein [Candidatus Poribacteria bacterium]|nr:tetratricopeptide repeat protein [Candidatus Poribacteria bacterium]
MLGRKKHRIAVCVLYFTACTLCFTTITLAQDETNDAKIIERYKLMLNRKPKEGSTFDRLYQFYLEGAGLDAMVADYQAEVQAKPDDPNPQLILGHIYKRLGKETEAVETYLRAVKLAPNNYYPHFALGQAYAILLQHENAINALKQAAAFAEETEVSATPEDLTAIYKALGKTYFRRDRVDEAISAWTKIAELDPQNIFARIELADLFREQELYEEAIVQHEAIIEFKKDDPYRVCLSRREIGNIREAKGDYEAAIQSYDAALALIAPGNWLRKDLQHRIIGIYATDGNWKGLIEYYQKKLETIPNEPELLGLLAAAYIENQQLETGIATYQKAVELAPTNANLRLNLITAFRNAERFEDAAAAYESLSEQNPDDFGIYRELGELYLQLEDKNKARTTYQRMMDRDPENAGTHLILAEIYAGHEWMADAAGAYQKAIVLAPINLNYIEYFGEFYFRQDNREKAIETWNQMVANEKGIAENYDRLAQLLDTKDFHTEALTASRKAVELMPEAYRYREALAIRLRQNKQYDAALTEYTEAARLAPNEFFAEQMDDQRIEVYRRQGTLVDQIEAVKVELEKPGISDADIFAKQKRLAKMYLKLENTPYALEVLLKAKALQPDEVLVNRWLAEIYVKQGRHDDANATYTHLTDIDNANAREYYTNIARIHLNAMDLEAAKTAAKQIIAHNPRNPGGYQLLAEIAKQSGNYDNAINNLKHSIRLRPDATDTRVELAGIYKLSGKPQQALTQYWQCWELSDSVSNKLAFVKPLSEVYYDLGQRNAFEEKLKQLSKTNASSIGPVLALAELYRMEGDLPNARFQLVQALERERENPELLAQLVKINLDLGNNTDALAYQQRLVKVQPDPRHQQKLGELLFDAGREQEAIQAWTKLLHTKNQTLEAELKLSALLIRHGLLDEALFTLERAAENTQDAKVIYQLGAALVEMNELERAQLYFQQILEMPTPPRNVTKNITISPNYATSAISRLNTNKFYLARSLVNQILRPPFGGRNRPLWVPTSFEEAQAGALVQLTAIAQQNGKLSSLIRQFEAKVNANPQDTQTLKLLAQLYTLTDNSDKTREITEQLLAASSNDPVYQAVRLHQTMQHNLNYETFKKHLDEATGLTPEARQQYIIQYTEKLYRRGKKADAEKLLDELGGIPVPDLSTGVMLVDVLVLMDKMDEAEKVIAQFPVPIASGVSSRTSTMGATSLVQQQYLRIYQTLADAYFRRGEIEKAIAFFWTFLERTQPSTTNPRRVAKLTYSSPSYIGYTSIQLTYPSPTTYYNQDRLQYLQQIFNRLLLENQQEVLYAKLQAELNSTEGRGRIYPGLALNYCYWWNGQRDKAQEILSVLEKEFSDDLTLKVNTAFTAIQTGQHETALALLEELVEVEPRNRRQYYDLMLQLAMRTGNISGVRELVTKLLNSPSGVRELYHFSEKLHDAGFTQYAVAVAKKTVDLAMREHDPNFLMELSQNLEQLGQEQDAEYIAERALRFANQRDRYGQTLHSWNFRSATRLLSRSTNAPDREHKLVAAVQKNPESFQTHLRLAIFYESTDQPKKASEAFEAALALRPKDSMTRSRYTQMLQRTGQAEAAVSHYMVLFKENPNVLSTYNHLKIVETFVQAGKVDELVSLAKELIVPSVGQNLGQQFAHSAARACIRNNNPKVAIEIYKKFIEVYPNRTSTYQDLASAYVAAGERKNAIQLLRGRLATGSTASEVEIVLKLTELYWGSSELEGLTAEYAAKLAEKPEDPALLYLVASMKVAAHNFEEAKPLVNQLLKVLPAARRLSWMNRLAQEYRIAGDRDWELRLLEAAIEGVEPQTSTRLPETYRKLAIVYAHKGEKEKAQNTLRKMGALRLLQPRVNYWTKEEVAKIYVQYDMLEDAEVLLTDLLNDFSVRPWTRKQAEQQLKKIKRRRAFLEMKNRVTSKMKATQRKPTVE